MTKDYIKVLCIMITFFQYEFVRIYDAFGEAPKMSQMEDQISLKIAQESYKLVCCNGNENKHRKIGEI